MKKAETFTGKALSKMSSKISTQEIKILRALFLVVIQNCRRADL
ncbi:hypothetical protein [Chryseobacterium shandongense]|nr:hypothetical protein [Chryseobacterium shandongense]